MLYTGQTGEAIFSKEFQVRLLIHFAFDDEFYMRYRGMVKLEDFDLPAVRVVYEALGNYYTKYGRLPPQDSLVLEVERVANNVDGRSRTPLAPEERESLYTVLTQLFATNPKQLDYGYMAAELPGFIRSLRVNKLVLDAQQRSLSGGNSDDMLKRLLEVNEATMASHDEIVTPSDKPVPLLSYDEMKRVTTGIRRLDNYLGKGLGLGEYGVVVACPGVGKTTTLLNFADSGAMEGNRVLFLTLELAYARVARRWQGIHSHIDAGLFKVIIPEWPVYAMQLWDNMLHDTISDRVSFCDKSTKSCTLDEVEGLIVAWKQQVRRKHGESEVDRCRLVCLDWLDCMLPKSRHDKSQPDWSVLKDISDAIARLARKHSVAFWTATQGTKEADGREILRMKDTAFGYHKCDAADIVLGIAPARVDEANLPDDDETSDKFALQCDRDLVFSLSKNRDNPTGHFTVYQGRSLRLWENRPMAECMYRAAEHLEYRKLYNREQLEAILSWNTQKQLSPTP